MEMKDTGQVEFTFNVNTLEEIFFWHQLICEQFIQNIIEERNFLFGTGNEKPVGIIVSSKIPDLNGMIYKK